MKTCKNLVTIFFLLFLTLLFAGLLYASSISPKAYLPVVLGVNQGPELTPTSTVTLTPQATPTSTTTSEPTNTPTPTPTSEANPTKEIPNGDFEDGRTEWVEFSIWDNVLIVPEDDLPRGVSPHNGLWAAWLGGDNDEEASIGQTVYLDPDFPYLAFWHWIDWPFKCQGSTAAEATIWFGQSIIWQSDVCEETDSGGWVKAVIDLTAYAGQSADMRLQIVTKGNSFANWYLDDIYLQSGP